MEQKESRKPRKLVHCLKCDQTKGKSKFKYCKVNPGGVAHYCKQCEAMHPRPELDLLGDKLCLKCGNPQPRASYPESPNGRSPLCSGCALNSVAHNPEYKKRYQNDKQREWREANPDRHRMQVERLKARPEFHEKRHAYIHSDHYRNNVAKKHDKAFREELRDGYVLKVLASETGLEAAELKELPGIEHTIKVKRQLLRARRVIKDMITKGKEHNG